MTDYFVGTKTQCEAIVAKLDSLLGYPDKNTKTYAIPRQHFSNPSQWFIPIEIVQNVKAGRESTLSEYSNALSKREMTLVSGETMLADGAWDQSIR